MQQKSDAAYGVYMCVLVCVSSSMRRSQMNAGKTYYIY